MEKSAREIVVARLTAAGIPLHGLAIEAERGPRGGFDGAEVRVTGAVPTAADRERAVAILDEIRAQGLRTLCRIEVRMPADPQKGEAGDPQLKFPPEPA